MDLLRRAVALWRAGTAVTHHSQFARLVGPLTARRLTGSPVAAMLRSLGSPENVYRQMATSSTGFSTVSKLHTIGAGPGFAEIVAVPVGGSPRSPEHCAWTCGLLTPPTVLFGLAPAVVGHDECSAFGAPQCSYRVSWDAEGAKASTDSSEQLAARRAPRHLLAVRTKRDGGILSHHKGFDEREVGAYVQRILEAPADLPASWLVVPVRSNRRDYGKLLAIADEGRRFFPRSGHCWRFTRVMPQARWSATALMESKERYAQSSALLKLARAGRGRYERRGRPETGRRGARGGRLRPSRRVSVGRGTC